MRAICRICGREYEKRGSQLRCDACIEREKREKAERCANLKTCPTGQALRQFVRDCDDMPRKEVAEKWDIAVNTVTRWHLKATGENLKSCAKTRYRRRGEGVAELKKATEEYAKIDTERAIRAYRAKHRSVAGATRIIPASEIPRGYIA